MKIKRSQLIITFLVGFAGCQAAEGSLIVLLLLMTFLAAGAFVFDYFGLTLKPPQMPLSRFLTNAETKPIQREAFVLGIGHQARR